MSKLISLGTALAIVLWSASGRVLAQDARAILGEASKAMGVETMTSVEYSATGFDFAFGQAYNPSSPWPKFINKSYKRAIDFRTPASKVDRIRVQGENPPRGGGQQPVIGDQAQSQTIIVTPTTPWVQQLEIWMTPHGFVRAALANNSTVKPQTVDGKRYNVVTFTGQNKAQVNGYINDQHLVERVETWIDTAYLGDTLFEAVYSDYRDFGGVKFPMKIVQRQGGYPIFDLNVERRDAQRRGLDSGATGQRRRTWGRAGCGGGAAAAGVPTEQLADGIYLILGGYAAVAVDFKDHIVVIEGPQSEARATQIIDAAKKLIPGKPIRYVVNTHHHFDHSMRAADLRRRGRHRRHARGEQGVFREAVHLAAHAEPRPAREGETRGEVRDHDGQEGADRWQSHRRTASSSCQRPQRGADRRLFPEREDPRGSGCVQRAAAASRRGAAVDQSVRLEPR